MLEPIIGAIVGAIDYITLGTYTDIVGLLPHVDPIAPASIFAWILTSVKWFMLAFALFAISKAISDRLNLKTWIPFAITAASIILILIFYNTPWHDAEAIGSRITSFSMAMSANSTNYTPNALMPAINTAKIPVEIISNLLKKLEDAIPNSINLWTLDKGDRFPALKEHTYNISSLKYLIYFSILAIAIVIIRYWIPAIGIILLIIGFMIMIGLSPEFIATFIIILACGFIAACLIYLPRFSKMNFLAAIPIAVIIVCLAYLMQPTQNVLIIMLIAAFMIFLYPWFYLFGLSLYAIGEVKEARTKLGMKKRPKKLIEEAAGSWDASMVAVILTLLFTTIMTLFGLTMSGLGSFVTISATLMWR